MRQNLDLFPSENSGSIADSNSLRPSILSSLTLRVGASARYEHPKKELIEALENMRLDLSIQGGIRAKVAEVLVSLIRATRSYMLNYY